VHRSALALDQVRDGFAPGEPLVPGRKMPQQITDGFEPEFIENPNLFVSQPKII